MEKTTLAAAAAALFVSATVSAELLPIENAGFEDVILSDGGFSGSIPGWEQSGTTGTLNPDAGMYVGGLAAEGENVAYSRGGWITQILSSDLEADTIYNLSVELGNRFDADFTGYFVQLWAGDMMLAEDASDLAPAEGTFQMSSVEFIAAADHAAIGSAIEIRLWGSDATDDQINFDDVRLLASGVPGAPVMGLFGIGALMGRRRR